MVHLLSKSSCKKKYQIQESKIKSVAISNSLYLVPFLKRSNFRGACKLHFTDAADGEKLLHCLGIVHYLTL